MPKHPRELAEIAFHDLLDQDVVELIEDEGELHIAGDDWTLVLEGNPVSGMLIALDDESGDPRAALANALDDSALAAMRDLNQQMEGELISLLNASPDPLANSLADLLES